MMSIWVQDSLDQKPEFVGHTAVDLEWFLDARCDSEYLDQVMLWFVTEPTRRLLIENGDTKVDIWYTTMEK